MGWGALLNMLIYSDLSNILMIAPHFAFSAYCRLQGWNKLADKWKEEAEEEWEEAEEVLQRLVELGCRPADRKEVDKAFAELKKEGAIVSPVRCKWEPAK